MSIFKLKTLMYWAYGVVATLIFSANFVGVAAYQYDVDSAAVKDIGLYRELATLASGLLLATIIPAIGLRKLVPVCFLFTAVISAVIFVQPSAIAFLVLYISLGFTFGILQVGFLNELAGFNSQDVGFLSDACHLEAVYMAGILVMLVVSGLLMQFQQLELHYLYLLTAFICGAIGLWAIFKRKQLFFEESSLSVKEITGLWLRTLPQIFHALGSTLVVIALCCVGLTITVTTFILNWISFFNTGTLQLSDSLMWQFSILLVISTISGRLVIAALVHYLPLLNILRAIIAISILCIMGFSISYYQYQITTIPGTMAELPTPMMLIIVMAFTNGGIIPLMVGTAAYHTPVNQRGIMLGMITFVMSGATLLSNLLFQWASKQFTPSVLLALMATPLAFVLILSSLFINDLRKSTSQITE